MPTLSVVAITRNEATRIRRCLESVAWADEVVVVDSGSTDGTADVCRTITPRVFVREFDTFDRQKNFALAQATGDWILSLDADEVVPPALAEELRALLGRDGDGYDGFLVRRENYLCGRPIVHAWGFDALVRVVRRGRGRFRREVHEKLEVDGRVGTLRAPLRHFNSDTLEEYLAKNHRYVALESDRRRRAGERAGLLRALMSPARVFLFRYVWLGGYRDGGMGFVLSALLAFFTFLVHARLWELGQAESDP